MREKLEYLKELFDKTTPGEWGYWISDWGKEKVHAFLGRKSQDKDFINEIRELFPEIMVYISNIQELETEYDIKLTKVRKALDKAGVIDKVRDKEHDCDRCLSLDERIEILSKEKLIGSLP